MLINGERVNSLNVEQIVDNIFGNSEYAKRKQSLDKQHLELLVVLI